MSNNATDISQELVTLIVPHFNISVPTVVHSVITSVSEYINTGNTSKHEVETPKKSTDSLATDSQQVVQEIQFIPQQEQEQQVQIDISGQLQTEAKEHKIDEQKLLQIADSWSSSTESVSADSNTDKKTVIEDPKAEPKEAVVEEVVQKEGEAKVEAVKADHEVHLYPEVTQTAEQSTNSTESPSIGERIESYWKAATGYVSKALNL